MISWKDIVELSKTYGDSFFVLDLKQFTENFQRLQDAFSRYYSNVTIAYSYKTNYTPLLCRTVAELGGYAEVVSEMEYFLARKLGVPGSRIIYNGPYKSQRSLKDAALAGTIINLDSMRDAMQIERIAKAHTGHTLAVAIRCNFSFEGRPRSRFGIDVEGSEFQSTLSLLSSLDHVELKGLHCHYPDRDLESFESRTRKMIALAKTIFTVEPPEFLNIGGGFFSNMPDKLRTTFDVAPATFEDYGKIVGEQMAGAYGDADKRPKLFIEPGTALVADTHEFYTKVVSTKSVGGRNIATVAGSIYDISPNARSRNLPVQVVGPQVKNHTSSLFDIAGYTCIENDVLSESVALDLTEGDFLCYSNVGSYSLVMKPPFILPACPVLCSIDNQYQMVRSRQTGDDVFRNFVL